MSRGYFDERGRAFEAHETHVQRRTCLIGSTQLPCLGTNSGGKKAKVEGKSILKSWSSVNFSKPSIDLLETIEKKSF